MKTHCTTLGVTIALAVCLTPSRPRPLSVRLPLLTFERNDGQTNGEVLYLSRGAGYMLFLTASEAVLSLRNQTLRVKFEGANTSPVVEGREPLAGRSHYFTGNDPNQWRTNIPQYGRVAYKQVYPGVDLEFYGNQGRIEYDFVVAPGADPGAIQLAFEGAGRIRVDPEGDLVLALHGEEIRHRRPEIYQMVAGQRQRVAGAYVIGGRDRIGFAVGTYDATRPLVLDPVLDYSTYLGGNGFDEATCIAGDSAGNAFVAGRTGSTNFPTAGSIQGRLAGAGGFDPSDVFVTKLNSTGTAVIYSTYLGGSGRGEKANGLAVDALGNAYLIGETDSTDFPTVAALQRTFGGGRGDAFVAKLNSRGDALVYSTYLGGSDQDLGKGIAIDSAGNAYLAGQTSSANFPTVAPFQRSLRGFSDGFLAKLNDRGAALVYSTYLGGGGQDSANAVAIDSSSNAYLTGETESSDFPTLNPFQRTHGGRADAFVVKFNVTGSALVYSTFLGGSSFEEGNGIAVARAGSAYVAGQTASNDFPVTSGSFQSTLRDFREDAFVTKLNPAGSAMLYSSYLGGNGWDKAFAIVVDSSGNAHVTGNTASSNFPTTADALQPGRLVTNFDAFLATFNPAGSALLYSSYLGGRGNDDGKAITMDAVGNIYVAGITESEDFPTLSALQSAKGDANSFDAWVAKFDFSLKLSIARNGVVNAASFRPGPIAPGQIISLFGFGLGPAAGVGAALDASGRLATRLADTQVLIDDVPAPLFYVRADQVNCQVPYSVAGKDTVRVQVRFRENLSNTAIVPVAESAPGIFALERGTGQAVLLNQDSTLNTRSNPVMPGSVVVLFATGEGQTNPAGIDGKLSTAPFPVPRLPVSLTSGGSQADVLFAGAAPGFAGLLQINARLPGEVAFNGNSPLILSIGIGRSQSGVTMAVGPKFIISNLRATGTNTSQGARLVITLDFQDPSGSATRDAPPQVNFDIDNGGTRGRGTFSREGVTPGQTSGTMVLSFTFGAARFTEGTNLPIVVWLVNGIGIESNQARGLFSVQ